ncbi:hypothetical protein [Pontiella sulfatireligans]|uniref:Uncharacterized protein n=1 Tax=Pontiella sulfatireligans TaxID=2750658 RepID=A0A6C2UFM0_9BACT|nr:hypothetical protein [Pontiella sulfatireligans]VGO18184.1 hypothetical protein SCARR_00235 [Pontiella sulfatireligans]
MKNIFVGKILFIGFSFIGIGCGDVLARSANQKLIRNVEYIQATEVDKYNWDDPSSDYLVLESVKGALTEREVEGLTQYALNAWLPTHNSMNYYFRKRSNSYMLEWLYRKDKDIALLNRAIEIARRTVAYRNDNIDQIDDRFTCYQISYDRSVATGLAEL